MRSRLERSVRGTGPAAVPFTEGIPLLRGGAGLADCGEQSRTVVPQRVGASPLTTDGKGRVDLEKVRSRCHPTLPARRGGGLKVEHEYERKGALCYLAAWDVRRARIFDRCAPKDGIVPFDALVEQFMSIEPYRSAQRAFVIVDNGSAHRGQRSIDRLQGAWPNLILVHTPVHASWLNQAEIYFSVLQRKVLAPNDFADLDALKHRLLAFARHYEQIARPFDWKFTRKDLHQLLARLDSKPAAQLAAWSVSSIAKWTTKTEPTSRSLLWPARGAPGRADRRTGRPTPGARTRRCSPASRSSQVGCPLPSPAVAPWRPPRDSVRARWFVFVRGRWSPPGWPRSRP